MRVLVTGATGFLGGVVARELAASGFEVWGVGRDAVRGQALSADGVRFVPLDLREGTGLRGLIAEADAVVHSAARSTLWGRWADFYADNVEVSAAVARACAGAGVRLVYISTPSVYNATGQTRNISESTPVGPAYFPHFDSLYAHSKYLAELEVQAAHPEATLLRPRGIYGPGDTSILPRLAQALRAGRLPRLDSGGEVHTELTHVRNVSHAVALAITRPAPGLYNITDGVTIPIWATLDRLADALGVPRPTRQANPRVLEAVARVLEAVYALHPRRPEPPLTASGVRLLTRGMTLDLTRARERLGYRPVIHPDQGLEEAIAEVAERAAAHA
ncbi:NAD(P)-dependent oxidoreductase [Deinococcus sp. QL22]|uniref:NAD-dependent epimerase/dehydratase family protein n=1 Tax=Deinococcus sp. QL22 TaxID=2939437 RepID=UPI0020172DA6|nr:NAD(P)-dependent oxidoreductase [Deinococcus sp. QL22]UQN07119.1 NAD(P)-dependent oxidoreductase [Deinococcus sp. QL22]